MAENKASFILYSDLIHTVKKMPKENAGELFMQILEYVNDLNPPEHENLIVAVTFEPIKQQLKRDLKKYEKKQSFKSEAGRLGGLKSGESRRSKQNEANEADASKTKQTQANEPVTVNGNVNVTVNGNVNKKEKKKIPAKVPVPEYPEFINFWLKEFHPDWEFKKIDGVKMKSIIEKIKTKISKSENPEAVPIEAFKVICNNLPTFYKSAQLSVIDSHLDTIIDEIKNKKNGSNSTGKQTRSDRVEKGMAGWRAVYDEGTRMQAESGESGDNQHGFDDTTNLRPTGSD